MTEDAILTSLRRCAVRYSRIEYEAEDLLQDVLLLAFEKGRAITDPGFTAWAKSVIRNHASFIARTAGRRQKREANWVAPCSEAPHTRVSLSSSY